MKGVKDQKGYQIWKAYLYKQLKWLDFPIVQSYKYHYNETMAAKMIETQRLRFNETRVCCHQESFDLMASPDRTLQQLHQRAHA